MPELDEVVPTSNALAGQIKSFAAGGFGGVCAVVTGHPFDLIKVRLQTAAPGTYKNGIECVKKTVAADGLRGLYRGVLPPLLGVTPMFAVSFWGYDLGKRLVSSVSDPAGPNGALSIAQISAAGFFSAIPTTAVAAPFERIKVILQIQGQSADASKPKFNGAFDVVKHLYKEGGLKSIFKGSLATVARDGPGSALYFATYEYLKKKLTPEAKPGEEPKLSLGAVSFAGGMAGMSMWIGVFPIDTIKSTLQSSSDSSSTLVSVAKKIYKNGGIKAFFPGIGPALARSFPANAATFVGVELAADFLNKYF